MFSTSLIAAFEKLEPGPDMSTRDFAEACAAILPIFDHLGTVFHFAKNDTVTKREDLLSCADQLTTLKQLVEADKAAGTIKQKGSHARNLDRLKNMVSFIRALLQKLAEDPKSSLKDSAWAAYESILAPTHAWAIRQAVSLGVMVLPSKESFLERLGEVDAAATLAALLERFVPRATAVVAAVEALYDEPIGRG